MTLYVIVDKFVRLCNRWPTWDLAFAGLTALMIAAHFSPEPATSVMGGGFLALIWTIFDEETRQRHTERFWTSYRRAR